MSAEPARDWRLEARLDHDAPAGVLGQLVGRLRAPEFLEQIERRVPEHVVITHDRHLLFAYAADEGSLRAARVVVEEVLGVDGIGASMILSHWDQALDRWAQVEPALAGEARREEQAAERDEARVETRTLVASSGRLFQPEFERAMLDGAAELGLECKLVEHRHLLTSQVAFTVTGPRRKIDEFAHDLTAEGWSTIRTDLSVLLSPL